MWRRFTILSLASVLSFGQQKRPDAVTTEISGDRFASGSAVRIDQPVSGDLFAAGGNVRVATEVRGDAVAAGGDVRIESPVRQGDVYAAGGRVLLNTGVGRNARIAAGTIEVGPQAKIHGNASLAGGQIEVTGNVDGYVQATGGRVYFNGPVDGDVRVTAREVELGPETRIKGHLRYISANEVKQDAGAQVSGGIERGEAPARRAGAGVAWIRTAWAIGLMLLAALLVGVMPGAAARISSSVTARPWRDALLGFIALVCIPVAAVLLLMTIVGLPIAMLFGLGYLALLLIGYIAAGIAVGDITLRKMQPAHASQRSWRIMAAVLGVLVILLLSRIPFVGVVIAAVALLIGSGAIVAQFARERRPVIEPF